MKPVPLCKDCAHFTPTICIEPRCSHQKAARSLINGWPIQSCYDVRKGNRCGRAGKWFEPAPPPPTKREWWQWWRWFGK